MILQKTYNKKITKIIIYIVYKLVLYCWPCIGLFSLLDHCKLYQGYSQIAEPRLEELVLACENTSFDKWWTSRVSKEK